MFRSNGRPSWQLIPSEWFVICFQRGWMGKELNPELDLYLAISGLCVYSCMFACTRARLSESSAVTSIITSPLWCILVPGGRALAGLVLWNTLWFGNFWAWTKWNKRLKSFFYTELIIGLRSASLHSLYQTSVDEVNTSWLVGVCWL